jgi:UDP-N-acetylmuramoyl-L-alanyl-D-glutamate--2,6-diaminopimelate ligase
MELRKLTRQREIGVRAIYGSQDADLSDPQYDSRTVKPASTFFAIRGFAQDGHAFITQAITKGATCIVLEDEAAIDKHAAVTWLLVENSRKALAIISEELCGMPSSKLRLIGVTGTNGKTTTTNLLKQLLEWKGERVGLIGTLGVWIGDRFIETNHTTPESRDLSEMLALMVQEGMTTCVMEVSSHAVALERIAGLDFDIAVFTNTTQDHLDFHKSFEEYAAAKQRFFTSLKPSAIAITNGDDAHGSYMIDESEANVYSYGIQGEAAFRPPDMIAEITAMTLSGSTFTARKRYNDEHAQFSTRLVGKFNVANVLAAAAALHYGVEGFDLATLAEAVRALKPVRGRFEQIALPVGALAVIDYAHTPDALQNLISAVPTIDPDIQRIITVFGCGGDRDRTKRPIMGKIAAQLSAVTVVTSDNPRTEDPHLIINEIVTGIPAERRAASQIEVDRKKAIEYALSLAKKHDVVLIAGKGHEDYQIIGKIKKAFDDKQVVLDWINNHV